MKKILCLILAFAFMLGTVSVSADEEKSLPQYLALLQLGSAGEGSTLNYFVLRTVMQYCDTDGMCKGKLFDGVVFTQENKTDTAEEIMTFLDELATAGGVFKAADQAAKDLKDNGYMQNDDKYPIFVSFPCAGLFYDDLTEAKAFSEYFLQTLIYAFNKEEYANIVLSGLYFGNEYEGNASLRDHCIALADAQGLTTLFYTESSCNADADACYYGGGSFAERLENSSCGVVFELEGVPNAESVNPLKALIECIGRFKECKTKPVLFTFEAYNNLYDCAIALEGTEPNKNGRLTYECINSLICGDYAFPETVRTQLSEEKASDSSVNEERRTIPPDVVIPSALGLILVGLVIFMFVRKAKNK